MNRHMGGAKRNGTDFMFGPFLSHVLLSEPEQVGCLLLFVSSHVGRSKRDACWRRSLMITRTERVSDFHPRQSASVRLR